MALLCIVLAGMYGQEPMDAKLSKSATEKHFF
jgi:hypothetical protein